MKEGAKAHRALTHRDGRRVDHNINEAMHRARAHRLQSHYIASFFREAFKRPGGTMYERKSDHYEMYKNTTG